MTGAPAARSSLARAETAIVADSLSPAMFSDGSKRDMDFVWRPERRRTILLVGRGNVIGAKGATPQTTEGVLVEQEAREVAAVTRGQNAVFVMPHDWASIAQFLGPLLERVDDAVREVQVLIITPDAEVAAAVTAAAVKLTSGRDVGIVAGSPAQRANRPRQNKHS